jgi:hypothetical protein
MIKLYFIIFLLLLSLTAPAQMYYQYFDGADTSYQNSVNIELDTTTFNVWQTGAPQKIIFDSASTTPNAIVTDTVHYYPANNLSRFKASMLNDWVPWGVLAFQWNQKLDLDTNDGAIVEFTIDDGATWENAFNNPYVYNFYGFLPGNYDTLSTGEYVFTGTDSAWKTIWLCFDLSWLSSFPDTIDFRFTLKSDSLQEEKEGWMIDNMIAGITMIHTVKSVEQTDYLNVYPNPTTDILHIEAEKMMDFHLIERMELVNDKGQVMRQWNNLPTKFWFDTKEFEEGFYLLKVKTNVRTETLPVVICKK